MGIGTAGDILVRAAHKDGLYIGFIDKKGLAIRNGGVFSQIQFSKQPLDRLAASCRSARPTCSSASMRSKPPAACRPTDYQRVASSKFTHAVVNTGKTPTILTLMGRDDFEPEELAKMIKGQCKPGPVLLASTSATSANASSIPSSMPTS